MRAFLKKLTPAPHALRERWYLRPFSERLGDPRLWCLQRRAVTSAFGAGLAICFIPLPVHMIVAGLVAVGLRLNVPVIYATIWIVNPLTAVPIYYAAYRVGALLLGHSGKGPFNFRFSWHWLETGLGPIWQPLLLGCAVCGTTAALLGWFGLELLWRWRVTARYRNRHAPTTV